MRTEWRVGRRWIWLALILLVFSVLVINATSNYSLAADETSSGTASTGEQKQLESVFWWFIRCSGWIGLLILVLSVYFVATVARMFLELRLVTAMPPEVLSRCEAMLEQRDFKGIFNVVKEDDSYFSRVLVTGITELPNGVSEARESMERVADMLTAEMDKKISMMSVLGTLGPMIGLLGTLKGMITSFSEIARGGQALDTATGGHGYFGSLVADVRGRGFGGAVDLFLLVLPEPGVADFGDGPDSGGRVPAALCPSGPDEDGPRRPRPPQGMRGSLCPVPYRVKETSRRT